MSDDKLVRSTADIAVVEDFATRIDESLRDDDDETDVQCIAFNTDGLGSRRCSLPAGHDGAHRATPELYGDTIVWGSNEEPSLRLGEIPPAPAGKYLSSADIARLAREREVPLEQSPCPNPKCILQLYHAGSHTDGRLKWVPRDQSVKDANLAVRSNKPTDFTRQVPLKKPRPWTVSLGAALSPNSTVTITEQMQIYFKAKEMICAETGGLLYIRTVLVGQRIQLAQWSGNGTRVAFLNQRTPVEFDTAQPGIIIAVTVENRSSEPGVFDMTLFGEAVMP